MGFVVCKTIDFDLAAWPRFIHFNRITICLSADHRTIHITTWNGDIECASLIAPSKNLQIDMIYIIASCRVLCSRENSTNAHHSWCCCQWDWSTLVVWTAMMPASSSNRRMWISFSTCTNDFLVSSNLECTLITAPSTYYFYRIS
jgi:hypothetical protein